jgi:hypothetical protein
MIDHLERCLQVGYNNRILTDRWVKAEREYEWEAVMKQAQTDGRLLSELNYEGHLAVALLA